MDNTKRRSADVDSSVKTPTVQIMYKRERYPVKGEYMLRIYKREYYERCVQYEICE